MATAWLVTWSWQAALLTAISTAVLRLATSTNASTRYLAWWITLAGVVVLAAVPWNWPLWAEQAASDLAGSTSVTASLPPDGPIAPVEIPPIPEWMIGVGALLWAAYSGRRIAALLHAIVRLRAIKRRCMPMPLQRERHLPLWLSVRHQGRSARLSLSDEVATGCMLGLGSPVIALPRRLAAALSPADLDRVVLHEYGHVQRRDDWTAVAQAAIEALLGWHPSVWWIGRHLRLEREVACDDWVIQHTVTPRDYASSLTKVAGLTLKRPALPFASQALRSRRELVGRVERLLDPMRNAAVRPVRSMLATGTLTLGSVIVLMGQTPPVVTVASVTDIFAAVPSVSFDPPPAMPRVASSRVSRDVVDAGSARAPMTAAQPHEVSPELRVKNQATLIQYVELRAPQRLGLSKSLRAVAPRAKPVLSSTEFSVETEPVVPKHVPIARPARLRSNQMTNNPDPGPWKRIAYAGKVVGIGASYAGVATASAFQSLGSSIARVFTGDR